jgi:hypothetical protein
LQQHCDRGGGVLCPSQRLEHSNSSLAHAHVGRVFAQYLLVALKHFLEIRVRLRGGFVVDSAQGDDALVLVAEARFEALEDGFGGGLVAGAQRRVEEILVDGP